MVNRQVAIVSFLFSMVISLLFLGTLVNVNYELDNQKRKVDDLQRQITSLKKMQEEDEEKVAGILKSTAAIEKDIDNIQELQRLQAQKLSEIIKKRK
jgi:septal ring factor EnvC (AmiA/AmiB activator)